jgi:ATP-dependent DNA helicase PIF1
MTPFAASAQAELTTCQTSALEVLQRQGNVFLTGAAGTGKSFLLDHYLHDKPADAFPVVASTGAAAVLVGGRTFHSFFGLGIMEGGLEATIARAMRSKKLVNRLQRACCVIIDEISMLSGATLFAADQIARRLRGIDAPWGGLRIIAVGDFAQLPPVTPGAYQKDWAFLHETWNESGFQPALLSTVMRTRDAEFLDILNFVRSGTVNDAVRDFLNARQETSSEETDATRLYPHRAKADEYNLRRLHSIPGALHTFNTQYAGDARAVESGKKSVPIPEVLQLKEGALIMMRKNDISPERLYVNGSLGHVRLIEEDVLTVTLLDGATIEVEKTKFTCLDGDGMEVMAAWNFPVTLAWATTIHKAQGASLDRMIVDLASLWEPGQAYVALSRVRSSQGLHIERWTPSSIKAEPLVTEFYNHMARQMGNFELRPLYVPQILPASPRKVAAESEGVKERRSNIIREMITKQATLEEMSAATGIKEDRVLLYMEDCLEQGIPLELGYLISDIPEASRIRDAFEEFGTLRLKPAFEALEEAVPYTTIRLVRCAIMAESGA